MIAFVFPGQGSQKKGMGQGLFDEVGEFAGAEQEIDRILGYSVRQLCLEDADNKLGQTEYTQPCLYVVNALHYFSAIKQAERPTFLAGHSLGEYNALHAAGVFDFVTGVKLVQKRGELMSQAKNGGMAAVIGLDADKLADVIREQGLTAIDVANFNSPSQTVISGPSTDIQSARSVIEAAGARIYMPLNVSAAFHSRYVADAAKRFEDFLQQFNFAAPSVPVIANVTGQPYPVEEPSAAVRSLLIQQITKSVQWVGSVRYLMQQGVSSFKELGPGNVLTKLIQQIQKG